MTNERSMLLRRAPEQFGPSSLLTPRRSGSNQTIAIFSFLILGVGLPAVMLVMLWDRPDLGILLLRLVLVFYAALRIAVILWDDLIRPIAGVFWIFVYVSLGIVPVVQLLTGRTTPLAGNVTVTMLNWTSAVFIVGCLAFDVGYSRRVKVPVLAPSQPFRGNLAMLRAISVIGLVITVYFISASGGLATFFANREDNHDAIASAFDTDSGQAIYGTITAFAVVPVLFCLLFYVLILIKRELRLSPFDYLLFVILIAGNVVVNNPISNSRYWTLAVLLGFGFVFVGKKKWLFSLLIVGGILAAIVVFPLSDVNRTSTLGQTSETNQGGVWDTLAVKDYDQFTMTANTIAYTETNGFGYGREMIGTALFWVPRAVWPDKPKDTGVIIGLWMQQSNVNLSSPLWAEAWINFGVFGVIAIFALVGVGAKKLDMTFAELSTSSGGLYGARVGIAVLAGYEFILLRGPLLQSAGKLATLGLVIFLLTRRPRASPGANRRRGVNQ